MFPATFCQVEIEFAKEAQLAASIQALNLPTVFPQDEAKPHPLPGGENLR
jgi:hypothetical protein